MVDRINSLLRKIPVWAIYAALAIPIPVLFYMGATGGLGVEPIRALERQLGVFTLKILIATLAVTPLRRHLGVNLIKFRRALGLSCFAYVTVHLLVWLVLDVQIVSQILGDIVKRPYITIGMLAFGLLVPLALTSNNWSVRRLGLVAWRRLHRLVYVAAILGGIHFFMLVKGFQIRPLIYLAIIVALLLLRLRPRRKPAMA